MNLNKLNPEEKQQLEALMSLILYIGQEAQRRPAILTQYSQPIESEQERKLRFSLPDHEKIPASTPSNPKPYKTALYDFFLKSLKIYDLRITFDSYVISKNPETREFQAAMYLPLDDKPLGIGRGSTKIIAEDIAAKQILALLKSDQTLLRKYIRYSISQEPIKPSNNDDMKEIAQRRSSPKGPQ